MEAPGVGMGWLGHAGRKGWSLPFPGLMMFMYDRGEGSRKMLFRLSGHYQVGKGPLIDLATSLNYLSSVLKAYGFLFAPNDFKADCHTALSLRR